MNILIVEDEDLAVKKIQKTLLSVDDNARVVGVTDSIRSTVEWLQDHPTPDLILMDIELADGQSFEIFKLTDIKSPVIFTTSYDEYALKAFKVNSIDYLLKPITFTDLSSSLQKFASLKAQFSQGEEQAQKIQQVFSGSPTVHKKRFMVKVGEHIRSITADQINMLYAEGRDVYLVTNQLRKFIIDYTLESLEEIVDPRIFFRTNRSYIVNIGAIQDVVVYSNSRLRITPNIKWDDEIIVSREKVNEFKAWFDGNQ